MYISFWENQVHVESLLPRQSSLAVECGDVNGLLPPLPILVVQRHLPPYLLRVGEQINRDDDNLKAAQVARQ